MSVLDGELPIGADFDVVYGVLERGKGAHDASSGSILDSLTVTWLLEKADGTDVANGTATNLGRGSYRIRIAGSATAALPEGSQADATTWVKLTITTDNPLDRRLLWYQPVNRRKN